MKRYAAFFIILCLVSVGWFAPLRAESTAVKMGVLPIVESLPFLIAQEKGLFQKMGVKVEIISFASALERDSAIQSGMIHGAIHDILGLSFLKSKAIPFSMVTNVTIPTSKRDLFVLLGSPGSRIQSLEDLRGAEVALSSHTVAEYVADGILSRGGLKGADVKKVEVKKIPLRFQMLMAGKVKAAMLPEPLASLAIFQGAKKIEGDYGLKGTQVVLIFQESFIREQTEVMIRLGRAYQQAVQMINEDPQRWRELLVEKGRLPSPIKDVYTVHSFSPVQLPDPEDVQAVKSWMEGKGWDTRAIHYPSLVNEVWMKGVR